MCAHTHTYTDTHTHGTEQLIMKERVKDKTETDEEKGGLKTTKKGDINHLRGGLERGSKENIHGDSDTSMYTHTPTHTDNYMGSHSVY